MKKKIISIIVVSVMLFSACLTESFGASSDAKKMSAYDVVKKGKYVYCIGYEGIYRVNIKNGTKKRIVTGLVWGKSLHLHKGYLYYLTSCGEGFYHSRLRRINLSNGKKSTVFKHKYAERMHYVIKKSKLYIVVFDAWFEDSIVEKKVMGLSGKNKKSTTADVKMAYKQSNTKGYKMKHVTKTKNSEYYTTYYLKTPKRTIKIDGGYEW